MAIAHDKHRPPGLSPGGRFSLAEAASSVPQVAAPNPDLFHSTALNSLKFTVSC